MLHGIYRFVDIEAVRGCGDSVAVGVYAFNCDGYLVVCGGSIYFYRVSCKDLRGI